MIPGSTQICPTHLFKQITGADFTMIPYRAAPDLVTALLRSKVDLGFDYFATFQAMLGADRLRIVQPQGESRDPMLPNVPTAKESGFPSYAVTASAPAPGCRPRSPISSAPRSTAA